MPRHVGNGHGAEVAAVRGVCAVVAHHPDVAFGHRVGVADVVPAGKRQRLLVVRVGLVEFRAVHIHRAIFEVHLLAGHGNHALDEHAGGIFHIGEGDDVALRGRGAQIRDALGEHAVARHDGVFHGLGGDLVGLHHEVGDEPGKGDGHGHDDDELGKAAKYRALLLLLAHLHLHGRCAGGLRLRGRLRLRLRLGGGLRPCGRCPFGLRPRRCRHIVGHASPPFPLICPRMKNAGLMLVKGAHKAHRITALS